MFKLQPNPVFSVKVMLSVPGNDTPAVITVTFRHLSRKQAAAYYAGLKTKTDAEGLAEIVTDWEGVDMPFSPAALTELLDNYPASAGELYRAFQKELFEAKAKN